eukprot:TRINITY_DN2077_c0_g1_i1.p1 TRINITY_DN2077_c0_g1~~TRINITY_DN2077_c0_g1_i1.p1  ORF type:complete len:207 (+),score=37.97 TRINITY_DN2077_c0_g1_i1:68-688(+)
MSEQKGAIFHSLPYNPPIKVLLLQKTLKFIAKLKDVEGGLETFLHNIADSFITKQFNTKRYEQYPADQLNTIAEAFKLFFKQSLSLKLTKEQMAKDLQTAGVPEDFIKLILDVFTARKEDIRRELTNDTAKVSGAYLLDFDWKLHMSLASDRIAFQREPLLIVSLSVVDEGSTTPKTIVFELNKNELDSFISELDAINEEAIKWRC